MKQQVRIITAICLTISILCTGCSAAGEKEHSAEDTRIDEEETAAATGRYVEETFALPSQAEYVVNYGELDDGRLRIYTDEAVYESDDGGRTWETAAVQPEFYAEESPALAGVIIGRDETTLYILEYADGMVYLMELADGTERVLDIELPELELPAGSDDESAAAVRNEMIKGAFTDDGNIIGWNEYCGVYLVDGENGEVLHSFGSESVYTDVMAVSYCDGKIYILKQEEGLEIYDAVTGSLDEGYDVVDEYVNSMKESEFHLMDITAEALYFADQSGVYRYMPGASQVECLINGELNSMSNQEYSYFQMLVCLDGSILCEAYSLDSDENLLFSYEYSEAAAATPGSELTIFSLNDHPWLQQAVSDFQAQNPDYYVNLEIGTEAGEDVLTADVITKLNTEIMAGTGPDIIVLDGLPADSYIENGVLADLSEVLVEVTAEGEYLENILYSSSQGKETFAVPVRFHMPVLQGETGSLEEIDSLSTLAERIEKVRGEDEGMRTVIGTMLPSDLVDLALYYEADNLIGADQVMDEEALLNLIGDVGKIFDYNYDGAEFLERLEAEEELDAAAYMYASAETEHRSVSSDMEYILSDMQQMNMAVLQSFEDIMTLSGVNQQAGWEYSPLSSEGAHTFIPSCTIGISAKSSYKEAGYEFVKYLLSTEMQAKQTGSTEGLPVSLEAFRQLYEEKLEQAEESGNEDGTGSGGLLDPLTDEWVDVSYNIIIPSRKDYEQLEKQMQQLDMPIQVNEVLRSTMKEQIYQYLMGRCSEKEATQNIMQKVNLYLAE